MFKIDFEQIFKTPKYLKGVTNSKFKSTLSGRRFQNIAHKKVQWKGLYLNTTYKNDFRN